VELLDGGSDIAHGELLVGVGVGGGELLGDGVDFVLRLLDRDPGLELRDDGDEIDAAVVARARGEGGVDGDPELLVVREVEIRRHDADDGSGGAVDADGLADDARIAAEVGLPERVTEDDGLVHAGLVLLGEEITPEHGGDAEGAEEVPRDVAAGVAAGLPAIGDVDGGAVQIARDRLERLEIHLADVLVVHRRHPGVEIVRTEIGGVDHLDIDEALGSGKGEAAEQGAVDDGEHRGDAADAEGEHGDGEGAEALFLHQHTKADADVLDEGLEEHGRERVGG
jgi:hypothetical protein